MNRTFLILLTLLLTTTIALAEETNSSALARVADSRSYASALRRLPWLNPANRIFRYDYSLTTVAIGAATMPSTADRIPQLGNGEKHFGFEASSQIRLDNNSVVYGNAAYTNGKRYGVRWNETSDFQLLYPFVMADSIGGTLRYEQYELGGGYAAHKGRWSYGASMSYRARSEYRTKDPRPKNMVADLLAKVSAGFNIGKKMLSVSAHAGKYKQTNEVAFFNELGASKEYHLLGLGSEFIRFSGTSNNVYFKGNNFGGSIDWLPTGKYGLSVSARINRFAFDKILPEFNRLIVNNLHRTTYSVEIAWDRPINDAGFAGVRLGGEYANRAGKNYLFGDAAANAYPRIGEVTAYRSQSSSVEATAFYETRSEAHLQWGISPTVGYASHNIRQKIAGNLFEYAMLQTGISGRVAHRSRMGLAQLNAGISYSPNLSGEIRLSEGSDMASQSLREALETAHRYLTSDMTEFRIAPRYDYAIASGRNTIFMEFAWEHGLFLSRKHHNNYELSIGITL